MILIYLPRWNQPILSKSDSDDTEDSLTGSDSESEGDDELNDSIATDNYYKTQRRRSEMEKNITFQRGSPSGINIVDGNTIGQTQKVVKF